MRAAVKGLDSLLRRCYGIHEYSLDPDCILRLGLVRAKRDVTLFDGTEIKKGDPVGDLHLWNERLPVMPPSGPGLRWAVEFQRKAKRSLELLADYVEGEAAGPRSAERAPEEAFPGLWDIKAFRAVGSLMSREEPRGAVPADGPAGRRATKAGKQPPTAGPPPTGAMALVAAVPAVATRLGLEVVDVQDPAKLGALRRFGAFWENAFNQALVWAYNPPSLRSRTLPRLRRVQLWISREKLAAKYGWRSRSLGSRSLPTSRRKSSRAGS